MRLVLASASPARLQTLRSVGLDPIVHVSGVDESQVSDDNPVGLANRLATLKGEAALVELGTPDDQVVVACDSVLSVDGQFHGKPGSDDLVRARWSVLRGRTGRLVTGHHVIATRAGRTSRLTRAATTEVHFAWVSDAEIEAYIATGEPQHVAGAFTLDGRGAAFITAVSGDPHNVVGISPSLLRVMLADLGWDWTQLWRPHR